MLKIAITGANGFVGSTLCTKLSSKGHFVTALVRDGAKKDLLQTDIPIQSVDYQNDSELMCILNQHDILIHCAAQTRALSLEDMLEANTYLTERLIHLCNQSKTIQQVVFLSSQAASGFSDGSIPKKEDDPCIPISWYGTSKLMAEEVIQNNCKIPWTIIRPCSVFGPGDKDFFQLFQLMEKRIQIKIGKQPQHVSLIYVEDLAELISCAIANPKSYKQVFFASDGKAHTDIELLDNLHRLTDKIAFHVVLPEAIVSTLGILIESFARSFHVVPLLNSQKAKELTEKNWVCSNQKARNLLEFEPKGDFSKKLKITYQWYKDHRWL